MDYHKIENFGEERFGMTEFVKRVNELKDENIAELFSGEISILLIENADQEVIHKFGELEAQDLYGKKTVPIGTNTPEDPHVWSTADMMWHQDRAYSDDVHPFVGLYCEAFDDGSSPTYFCDMKKAYQNWICVLDRLLKRSSSISDSTESRSMRVLSLMRLSPQTNSEMKRLTLVMKLMW